MYSYVYVYVYMLNDLYLYMRVYPQVDFSVDNDLPVYKSRMIHKYTKFDARYPALVCSL